MRDIEFRGKRIDTGEWVFGGYMKPSLTALEAVYAVIWDNVKDGSGFGFHVIPETVGQYTGIKDKNGVKIFEGDIIKYHDFFWNFDANQIHIGVIEWQENAARFVGTRYAVDGKPVKPEYGKTALGFHDVEIIGNVFENPELLEEPKQQPKLNELPPNESGRLRKKDLRQSRKRKA